LARRRADDGDDAYRHRRSAERQVVDWMEKVSDAQYGA
jgi:hypothetical protein